MVEMDPTGQGASERPHCNLLRGGDSAQSMIIRLLPEMGSVKYCLRIMWSMLCT